MARVNQIRKPQEQLAQKQAEQFAFKSRITGPIGDLTLMQRSLLFAEISMISYLSLEQCNIAAGKLGFVDGKFFNSNNAQAYWFQSEFDSVVVCRGTEAREWGDIQADANALAAVAETVGRVHRGFKAEVDEIWPYLEKELETNTKPLWFCGHSLGGAMANICAGRCMLSYIRSEPEELYTFGSPRVGCRRYVNHVKLKHYRWVNNNDVVTRIPPPWLGYRHNGEEMYLDRFNKLTSLQGWRRVSDRLQGFLGGLLKGKVDQIADHSAVQYIDSIFGIVRSETPLKFGEVATTVAVPEETQSVSDSEVASPQEPVESSGS